MLPIRLVLLALQATGDLEKIDLPVQPKAPFIKSFAVGAVEIIERYVSDSE